jgi:mono/diheme cytochrome c family protein
LRPPFHHRFDEGSFMNNMSPTTAFLASIMPAALVIAVALSLFLAPSARATEAFAKQTGQACGQCHTSAKGGGPLTPAGEKFKANGNKLPKVAGK